MKQLRTFLLVCCLLGLAFIHTLYSQTTATTEDGKKVLLKPDGTWEYIREDTSSSDHYTFRKTTWGMTKEQVKKTENSESIQEDDEILAYKGTVADLDCIIGYVFADGKLVRTKYRVLETHTNRNDYISDYNSLKKILTEKYAKPKDDKTVWKNDLYRTDRTEWGFAVSLGHLVYYCKWENNESDIILYLHGENYEISLDVEYSSKALKGLEEKKKKKKALTDF